MAQTQVIKRRIRSVKSTKQITKAMELVAASKMRKAQGASLSSRTFSNSALELLHRLSTVHAARKSLFFKQPKEVKNELIVLVTSDRGLAGAYNSNVLKLFISHLKEAKNLDINSKVIVIGNKGARSIAKIEGVDIVGAYTNFPANPTTSEIRPIYQTIVGMFSNREIEEAHIIYTDFISTINQQARNRILLPIKLGEAVEGVHHSSELDNALFEPSAQAVMEEVVPRLVEAQLYQAILDATASEHSMRMMAMKSASDNASELIDDLTLEFNTVRQASITQELAEITGGAEAIA